MSFLHGLVHFFGTIIVIILIIIVALFCFAAGSIIGEILRKRFK